MGVRLSALPFVVAAAATTFVSTSRDAHAGVTVDGAPCRFSGRVSTRFALYGDALSTAILARAEATYDVTLDGLAADVIGTHVQVHAASVVKNRPPVTFDAFTDLASFELHTAHDVAVVPDHVWIRRNELVSALGGALGRMQIETPERPWPTVSADVPCTDVALPWAPPDPVEDATFAARFAQLGTAVPVLLVDEDAVFRASPGGPIVYRFTRAPGSPEPALDSYESQGAYTRVVHRGTPFLDAWVDSAALERPPVTMGWTCGSGKLGKRRAVTFGKRIPLVVTEETELRLAPHGARVLATLRIGTALIGRDDVDGWMRVELKDHELVAGDGEAFWVPAASVARTKWRRH